MKSRGRKAAAACMGFLFAIALYAAPSGAQTEWTVDPSNPVIPNVFTGGYALHPSVVYDESAALYRMWFTGRPYGGPWDIDYALSTDGINWFSYAKNPVLVGGAQPFEADGVLYGAVVHDGTQYRMYYTGLQDCCGAGVGLATSADGIQWAKHPGNPVLTPTSGSWDSESIGAVGGVHYDGHTYYLFYQGVGGGSTNLSTSLESTMSRMTIVGGSLQQIGLATSTDGVTFTKSPFNPVIPRGPSGAWDEAGVFPGGVFAHKGTFYAFYAGAPADFSKESLGLVTSTDGSTWIKDVRNPVFEGTSVWDWHIGSGSPVLREGKIHLWYPGNVNGGNEWSIGYATAPLDAPTGTLASLVSADADPSGVHLVWTTTAVGSVRVYRRDNASSWSTLGTQDVIAGRVRFDDVDVRPGVSYAYSIGSDSDSRELFAAESWIEVPSRPVLQLRGAQPNPAAGAITASLELPTSGNVRLELFDLAGRRVLPSTELDLKAGAHLVPLPTGGRAAPGVYLVRMSFAGQSLESRVVVAR